jgi:dephospho-CoA kinase
VSLLVGLTGGIGSGKSLAAKFFKEQGAYIIDSDQLCRDFVRKNQPALKEIVDSFGESILKSDGNLNREDLAKIIFHDNKKKSTLEAILHPKVIAKGHELYLNIKNNNPSAIVIIDAALLIESGNFESVDKVIVIQSTEEQQLKRILSRNYLSRDQALVRIKNQMSLEDKNKYADYTLDNNLQPKDLKESICVLYKKLLKIK